MVNKLAGHSILAFMRSLLSRKRHLLDPSNPLHSLDHAHFDELYERLLEDFKRARSVLVPDEVPQEEKIRMITDKLDGDLHKLAEGLEEYQKCEVAI